MPGGREYRDILTLEDLDVIVVSGDPNGLIAADQGTIALDDTGAGGPYRNIDGAMTWINAGVVPHFHDALIPQDPADNDTDYFPNGALDAAWIEWDPQSALTVTAPANGQGVTLTRDASSVARFNGLIRSAPAHTRYAITAMCGLSAEGNNLVGAGLVAGADLVTNPTTDPIWTSYSIYDTGGQNWEFTFQRWTNYNGTATTHTNQGGRYIDRFLSRIFVDTIGGTIEGLMSSDGENWARSGPIALADTISYVGLVMRGTNAGEDSVMRSRMFRVDNTTDPLLQCGEWLA